ncbi:MAG: metallophosphoesterase [Woeseiaceae bacterium]|nr:metallophosphoesterase [Woeseiaceae bacterium]MDX2608352.1 metallophosphoesterase [Woeseiaceae bacterium]
MEGNKEVIRVLHLTDPHLFAGPDGELRGRVTAATLERVLDHYQASDWRAQRVLVTGDLIQDDSPEAYERFRNLMLPLDLRVHCVPGNHDIHALMRSACGRPPFSYCAWEEIGEWLIVGIDSCVAGDAGGRVSGEELDRLAGIVVASTAKHVMVCLHHPPVPMGSAWLDSVGLKNGEQVLERLRTLDRVRIAAFGHVHQEYDAEHEGIRIIATPSTCRQFKRASDDFAVDENPPAYRRFELNSDGSVDTEVIWVNE